MISNVEVESGVPLPVERRRYQYASMEIGDCFVVRAVCLQVVCNANYRTGKKLGRKFVARKTEDGVRVWRTA
jgi:hypothetical protein